MKIKINLKTFLVVILLLIVFTFVSFFGAVVAADDGGSNFITVPLQYIFIVLSFPMIFAIGPSAILKFPELEIIGLAIDIVVYAFLIERLYSRLFYRPTFS
jgi:hypothetical protein